jgi:Tfp pilus assembly protein PilF
MYREVLLARRDVLGEESRDTLATWHALAYTIERQGRRTEAAAEYRQVLDADDGPGRGQGRVTRPVRP